MGPVGALSSSSSLHSALLTCASTVILQRGPGFHPCILHRLTSNVRPIGGLPPIHDPSEAAKADIYACWQQMRQGVRTRGVARGGVGHGASVRMRIPRDLCKNGTKRGTLIHEPSTHAPDDETAVRSRSSSSRKADERGPEEEVYYHVGDRPCFTFYLAGL